MALTLSKVADGENVKGRHRSFIFDVALDTSYPSGGYTINATDVGLKFLLGVVPLAENPANATSQYVTVRDLGGVTKLAVKSVKLRLYSAGSEVTATTDVHTVGYRFEFFGF